MPSVNDMVGIAESLQKCSVYVDRDRCVAVRNRNASCRECIEACPNDAITIEQNNISVEPSRCVDCGACSVVCPTEALVSLKPIESEFEKSVADAAVAYGRKAVIACARISSKHIGDPDRYTEVPCLARVDEGVILKAAAAGVTDVLLVDGNCSTCKYRACVPGIDDMVGQAQVLLQCQGSQVQVRRASEFPADMVVPEGQSESKFGSTRRGFFSETVAAAKEMTLTAAQTAIEQELGGKDEPDIGERLRVNKNGALPQFRCARHDAIINAMYDLGEPRYERIETRVFGSVTVDTDKCNGCGMCAVFCPTDAMRRDESEKPYTNLKYLEFSASDCVQCGLCVDVCWKKCLTLSPVVSTSQLFDFEPVTFDIDPAKRKRNSILNSLRSSSSSD